ncbi:19213_t:CDS:2 [Racocetra fulgida]|uniref:19213_t:CDS:1 n=1 Tax=Racocetra fulgida TaxID=60492 RepID=A0A9N9E0F6_9GLOM|nr:19213_t:CDS:2 [Racocetra fulgida]
MTTNPKNTATELSYQLNDSGASVLIVHPKCLEVAIEALIDAKIPTSRVLLFGDKEIKEYRPYRSILIDNHEIEPIYYSPEEAKSTTAYLLYSSGTTGKPKCIERTHANVVANLTQLIIADGKIGPHSITMGTTGATTIIHSSIDVEKFCEFVQKFKINHIYAAPPIILELVNNPLVQQFDLSSMNTIINAGAPLRDEWKKKFYNLFKIPILQCYGLSETCVALHYPDTSRNAAPGIMSLNGTLLPNMETKILSEDGRELGYNESGELWVHGPNIMKGYFNNKEATDAVFDKDGFFNTGDIAYVDEQELIRYKDFYVPPSELESILLTHDAVSDAVVVGYYSEEEATEIPIAYVTIKNVHEQSQALAKEIQSFVDDKVAPHKQLRGGILFIDKIPRCDGGKIQRKLLREKLMNKE